MSSTDPDVLTGRVGEPVQVRLESVPSSGAMWHASVLDPGGEVAARESIARDPSIGGRVEQVFEFRARAPGTYQLRFDLKRAWEDVVHRQRYVTVRVEAADT